MKPETLLQKLLDKGDIVAIENGRLVVHAASGKPIPEWWLVKNRRQLLNELASLLGTPALLYKSYSTGFYGSQNHQGVTLQFICLTTSSPAYVILNAHLNRIRSTKHGRAGTALPKNQFRVGENSLFYKLWEATDSPMPNRLSSFYDRMGNLKNILFSGAFVKGERLRADSIRPIHLTYQEIKELVFNTTDIERTFSEQSPDNNRTLSPDKQITKVVAERVLQPFSTTCLSNYGRSMQGSTDTRTNVTPTTDTRKRPKEQTIAEWLTNYELGD